VPLILHGPGVPKGLRIEDPVSLVDLAPTLLSLAGVESDEPSDGLDLTPLLAGSRPSSLRGRPIFGEASGGLTYALVMENIFPVYRSLRRDNYKLIHDSKNQTFALYDLNADPQEKVDISSLKPDLKKKLTAEMQQRYDDFSAEPAPENRVELDREELERLRALGYVP